MSRAAEFPEGTDDTDVPHMKTMSKTGLLCLGIFFLAVAAGEGQSPTPSPQKLAPSTAVSADQSGTEAETERIIVTGSNIPTAEEVGPNPVQTIDRAFIEKSGERTAEQRLRNLPVAGPQGVPSFNGQNFFAPGASSISLRGFDPSDTLVLIDGRRVATYPQGAGGAGTQSFVDLNSIPKAAIESIEILKDSASTTYGADAVAGVVNIKLRHDYMARKRAWNMEIPSTKTRANSRRRSFSAQATGRPTSPACSIIITATPSSMSIAPFPRPGSAPTPARRTSSFLARQ
ncbi:MAG: TonB-dependent receptor plug domain-containing protein [Chthoniobacterales bacterium]|nr:TonB-dependent receptor plug domain-containing protein [Chthoniobacterales bacterium]